MRSNLSHKVLSNNIIVKQPLDREKKASYDLRIVSTDKGSPPLETIKTIHINIGDINDNAPQFYRKDYKITVNEDAKADDVVITVQAIDQDIGQNGCFNYSMDNNYGGQFKLDQRAKESSDGNDCEAEAVISLARPLEADGNVKNEYELTITATDHGEPAKSDYTKVTINVGDVNDNKPIFNQSRYEFNVIESTGPNEIIGRALASDADKGPENSRITYSWFNSNQSPFTLNADTGEISTLTELDAEVWKENSIWNYEIEATDHGAPEKSSKAQVTINLIDENDNAPRFIAPNPKTDVQMIKNTIENGDIILDKIEAEDKDWTASNNKFHFQLGKRPISVPDFRSITLYDI